MKTEAMQPARTRFIKNWNGSVTMTYRDDEDGAWKKRTFYCGADGGQVLEDGMLVCERLGTRGEPLKTPTQLHLLAVIRREHKAKRRARPNPPGRPAKMRGGQLCQLYLDEGAIATAVIAGDGNMSAGVRAALAEWLAGDPARREAYLQAVGVGE